MGEHGDILRRSSSLKLDLADVAEELSRSARKTPATEEYVAGIKRAAEADRWANAGHAVPSDAFFACRSSTSLQFSPSPVGSGWHEWWTKSFGRRAIPKLQ